MANSKEILFGLYSDETDLMDAIKKANTKHLEIYDVFSPFPVHGLDPLLGLKESRLHIAGFIFGSLGCLFAFLTMTWIFTQDWPVIFGGKPYWSVPAFIPITFEFTVLSAAIGMVVSYYLVNGQGPGFNPTILHDRLTDDKFAIAFNLTVNGSHEEEFRTFLTDTGAEEIQVKNI